MSELEDRINGVLNDPKQMEQIASLARSLMGGEAPQESVPLPDAGMLKHLSGLMNGDADTRDRKLLDAMQPYLSEKRRSKMDRAIKLAKLARLAALAAESGGLDDV